MTNDARDRVDLLLLAAFGPELAPLKPAFASSPSSTDMGAGAAIVAGAAGADVMNARIGSLSVQARACGIGLPAAAAFATLRLGQSRPRAVVLLGTCGAYVGFAPPGGAELGIGDVIVSRRIVLVDWAALEGHAQFPPATAEPIAADARLVEGLVRAGAAPADVANTLGITVNDDVAARIAKQARVRVEHLEAYGVATACAALGVPFVAVLGVANAVGSTGRTEWRSHHVRASEAAAQRVLAWIETSAADELARLAP